MTIAKQSDLIHKVNVNLGVVKTAIKSYQGDGEVWDFINDLKDAIMDADLPNASQLIDELTDLHNHIYDKNLLEDISDHVAYGEDQIEDEA